MCHKRTEAEEITQTKTNYFSGPFDVSNGKKLYRNFLIPKLLSLFKKNGLQDQKAGFDSFHIIHDPSSGLVLREALRFVGWINTAFAKVAQGDFLEERPDLYLGRLLSMFAYSVYPADLGYTVQPDNQTDILGNAIYKIVTPYSSFVPLRPRSGLCLALLKETLLPQHYGILLNIIKHSQLGYNFPTAEDVDIFFKMYVETASNIHSFSMAKPKYLEDSLRFLDFCGFGSSLEITNKSLQQPAPCRLFQTTLTGRGMCHTFNGLQIKDAFRKSPVVDIWNEVFAPIPDVQLEYPTGYGQHHGLSVVLNMFRTISLEGTSKNAILSVTNEYEWVSIIENHFNIRPGNSYTFKVLPSQIIATQRLKATHFEDRNCMLPYEIENLNFMKNYTKGGCLYECAIKQIAETCNCTTWNIPKNNLSNPPFCEEKKVKDSCIEKVYSSFSAKKCKCPSNCADTIFSVFDYKESLENPGLNCYRDQTLDRKKDEYPFNIYCNLCRRALKFHKILFVVKYGALNLTDFPKFCNDFLMSNIAIIKIELANPGLTQTIRDKRFNFESQLSGLGEFYLTDLF